MSEPGGTRVGDAERQAVVDLLRHHTGEGRLTLDEFSDLVGEVYAALTRDDLDAVVAKLPEGVRPTAADPSPSSSPVMAIPAHDSARRREPRRWFVAIMSGSQARGAWRAPPRISALAFWGHVNIDLRNALIESPVVEVRAWALMGGVTITVPPGVPVDLGGFVLMGGSDNRVRSEDLIPGAPLVRVRAAGMWGGVTVRNPSRRNRHRDRHDHRRRTLDHAHRHVEDALDLARTMVDRALPPPSRDDRIPPMPRPGDPAETIAAPAPAPSSTDRRTAGPATDRAPAAPAADGPPDAASNGTAVTPGSSTNGPLPGPAATAPVAPTSSADATAVTPALGNDHAAGASAGTTSAEVPAARTTDRDEPRDERPRRVPSGTLTMLVSDIAGSTQMAERLGDQAWIEVLGAHNDIVRSQVAEHGGTEVKAQGDGFLVVFPSARAAVLAAIAIQQAMDDYSARHPDLPVRLRVGLHTGEVVVVDDDVFGQNVVVTCRIADAAEPGEIVVSGLTRDLAASASDLGFDDGTDVELKGLSQRWRVHRVLWNGG